MRPVRFDPYPPLHTTTTRSKLGQLLFLWLLVPCKARSLGRARLAKSLIIPNVQVQDFLCSRDSVSKAVALATQKNEMSASYGIRQRVSLPVHNDRKIFSAHLCHLVALSCCHASEMLALLQLKTCCCGEIPGRRQPFLARSPWTTSCWSGPSIAC